MKHKRRQKIIHKERCYLCGNIATHQHHIIPHSLGGQSSPENLVPLCDECEIKIHLLLDPIILYIKRIKV